MIVPRSPYPLSEFIGMAWRRFTPPEPWGNRPVSKKLVLNSDADITSWIGFTGDICPLNDRKAQYETEVLHFFDDCSLIVGNFEGVLTNKSRWPFLLKHTPSIFEALQKIKPLDKWVLSVANNHAVDYGVSGLQHTIHEFEKRSIRWLGTRNHPSLHITSMQTSFTAWTWWINGQTAVISQTNQGPPTKSALHIALPHWGYEHERKPRKTQRSQLPDGYQLVAGHHSHLPQPLEECKPQYPVAWSLGNFLTAKQLPVLGEGAVLKIGISKRKGKTPVINEIHYQAILLDRDDPGFCTVKFRRNSG